MYLCLQTAKTLGSNEKTRMSLRWSNRKNEREQNQNVSLQQRNTPCLKLRLGSVTVPLSAFEVSSCSAGNISHHSASSVTATQGCLRRNELIVRSSSGKGKQMEGFLQRTPCRGTNSGGVELTREALVSWAQHRNHMCRLTLKPNLAF